MKAEVAPAAVAVASAVVATKDAVALAIEIECSVRSAINLGMMQARVGIDTLVLKVVHRKLILHHLHRIINTRDLRVHSSGLMHLQYRILDLDPGLVIQQLHLGLHSGLGLVTGLARPRLSGLVLLSGPLL